MKKHLIAAAVAAAVAAPAMAQNVAVYGILSSGIGQVKNSADGYDQTLKTSGFQGAQSGSRLGVRGTEDVGGGLKLGFVYELGANIDTGLGANRLGFLSLDGGHGSLKLGKVDSITRSIYNSFTAHGNSGFAPGNMGASGSLMVASMLGYDPAGGNLAGCANQDNTSGERAGCSAISTQFGYGGTRVVGVDYTTPTMSGFTVRIQAANNFTSENYDASNRSGAKQAGISVNYSSGPLALTVGREDLKTGLSQTYDNSASLDADIKAVTTMIGATYEIGPAKLFANYTKKTLDSNGNSFGATTSDTFYKDEDFVKETAVGISLNLGSGLSAVAAASKVKMSLDDNPDSFNAYQLQLNYDMSKRTRLYAMAGQTGTYNGYYDGVKVKGYVLGMQHSF